MNNQSPPMSTGDYNVGDVITLNLPEPPPSPPGRLWYTSTDESYEYLALTHAISHGNLQDVINFLDVNPEALGEWIDNTETPLLKACSCGQLEIVIELLRRMTTLEQLLTARVKQSHSGFTPLIIVAATGNLEIAKVLVAKCPKLTEIPSIGQVIAVLMASMEGNKEMTNFLYHQTPLSILFADEGIIGSLVLSNVIKYGFLDIALDIFEACPRLILSSGTSGRDGVPLHHLALRAESFKSNCDLPWWKQIIYSCIEVGPQNDQEAPVSNPYQRLLWEVLRRLPSWFGIKRINEMKETHIKAHKFLKLVCEMTSTVVKDERWMNAVHKSLVHGTMKGNKEFVVEMIKSNPHLINEFQAHENRNIFQLSVQHRNSKIFNLIYGMDDRKKIMLSARDIENNTILHVAGALSPSDELSKVSGTALKMQREIQWYKEVESLVPEVTSILHNLKGKRPREVFEEAHEPLRKEAEEWMKYTASACSFVAALVATVTFQAIFTVPGGTDDSSGDPLHLTDARFMIFTIADTLSFFSSCTSVLIFLTILTSRYSFDDFLVSLPKKMILGLSIMFFSLAAMLVAFSTALFTMLTKMPLLVIPVLPLAFLPATLFVLLQYPLLKEMISSTYGNNLFKRDTKIWF